MNETKKSSKNQEPKFKVGDSVWTMVGSHCGGILIGMVTITSVVYRRYGGRSKLHGYLISEPFNGLKIIDTVFATRAEAEARADKLIASVEGK